MIRIVRSPIVARRPTLGAALLDALDLESTRSLGRLEAVVADLCVGVYRRQWLGASRRLLALAGHARRGEMGARRIARALATAPFLFEADDGERASIVQLLAAVGIPRILPHLHDGRRARALGTFLAITDGNEASRLFGELAEARPFTADDRHRMSHKLLARLNHAVVDRADVLRFAVRIARRFADAAVAERVAAALAGSPEDRTVLAMTLARPDATEPMPVIAAGALAGS